MTPAEFAAALDAILARLAEARLCLGEGGATEALATELYDAAEDLHELAPRLPVAQPGPNSGLPPRG
jgi:hypothetical protein